MCDVDANGVEEFVGIHQYAGVEGGVYSVKHNCTIEDIPQDSINLQLDICTWNHFDRFDCSKYASLQTLVIGVGCCSRVQSFCLDQHPSLRLLSIQRLSFSVAHSSNCVFRISGCPQLKTVDIGQLCFKHFSTFSVSDAPKLSLFRMGAFSFIHASTFEMLSCPSLLLFTRSPDASFSCAK